MPHNHLSTFFRASIYGRMITSIVISLWALHHAKKPGLCSEKEDIIHLMSNGPIKLVRVQHLFSAHPVNLPTSAYNNFIFIRAVIACSKSKLNWPK